MKKIISFFLLFCCWSICWGQSPMGTGSSLGGISGSMKMYESTNAVTIDANLQYHLISDADVNTGVVNGVTFSDGATGAVQAFYDRGASNLGVRADLHGLSTGDIVSITGPNIEVGDVDPYYGIYKITVADEDSFYIANSDWNASQTATWNEGAFLSVPTAGNYTISFSITGNSTTANADVYKFELYADATEIDLAVATFTSVSNEVVSVSGVGIVALTADQKITLAVQNVTDDDNWDLENISVTVVKQ